MVDRTQCKNFFPKTGTRGRTRKKNIVAEVKQSRKMAEATPAETTQQQHDDDACPHGGNERQAKGFMLPDSLDTQREQQFDRMGTSVIGPVTCKSDVTMTNPICRMGTTGFSLEMKATYDRHTGKCNNKR